MEQPEELKLLLMKYMNELKELEMKTNNIKHKILITTEVLKLVKQEGILKQNELFASPSLPISRKYKNMTMRQAIMSVFKLHPGEYLSTEEVYTEVMRNGFRSKSKNVRRDLSIRLSKFTINEHILEAVKIKHRNKYRIAGGKWKKGK